MDVQKLREAGLTEDQINDLVEREKKADAKKQRELEKEIAHKLAENFPLTMPDKLTPEQKCEAFDKIHAQCMESWEHMKSGRCCDSDHQHYVYEAAMVACLAGDDRQGFWKAVNVFLG